MASKQITRTLVADGERVHFEKSEGKLIGHVVMQTDDPMHHESRSYIVAGAGHDAGLTAQERSDLIAILGKLYGKAKADAAYV